MKMLISFSIIFPLMCALGSAIQAREYRGLFGHWFNSDNNVNNSPCHGCPYRNCLDDRAVVLGYCCGCARVSDYLPIDCPALHYTCPPDGRRLCHDYDYMLNCCC